MKKTLVYSVVAFWLIMTAFFLRREIIPTLYAEPLRGYGGLRAYAETHPGHTMGIYVPGSARRIGTSETAYELKKDRTCVINQRLVIDFRHFRVPLNALTDDPDKGRNNPKFELTSQFVIDPDDRLQSFSITMEIGLMSTVAHGAVRNGAIHLTVDAQGHRRTDIVPIEKDQVVGSGFMPVGAMRDLSVGQAWQLTMLDPLRNFRPSVATARVVRRTRIHLRGAWYPAYEIEIAYRKNIVRSWVSLTGEVLKEEAMRVVWIREPLPHETSGRRDPQLTTSPTGI